MVAEEVDRPRDAVVDEALVAAHGPVEVAGFDALEALQCLVERRRGGETGVRAVTCLSGPEVWRAGDEGRWSWALLDAALERTSAAEARVREIARMLAGEAGSTAALDHARELLGGRRRGRGV